MLEIERFLIVNFDNQTLIVLNDVNMNVTYVNY